MLMSMMVMMTMVMINQMVWLYDSLEPFLSDHSIGKTNLPSLPYLLLWYPPMQWKINYSDSNIFFVIKIFLIISRPGQSQGLLYIHRHN